MRRFAQEYPDIEIVQQAAAQLPWFHVVVLLTKVSEPKEREWYAVRAVAEGWSRATLEKQRDIENVLVRHITQFLLELGAGFAFLGRQVRLEVAGDEFFMDLLFYHTRLKCYVVVELKATEFRPAHAGQLNFYLSAVDAQMKAEDDRPTIRLLLCKTKNRLVAEYALNGIEKPMGIAEYELVRALPERLERSLPSVEELEAELSRDLEGEA